MRSNNFFPTYLTFLVAYVVEVEVSHVAIIL